MRDRQTAGVTPPNEQDVRAARALLAPLTGLARALGNAGSADPAAATALLQGLAAKLGARTFDWHPETPAVAAVGGGRRDARTIDWGRAGAIPPGRLLTVGAEQRRRSPRLAAGEGWEVLIAPTTGHPRGLLRIASGRPIGLSEHEFVALADLVAGLARHAAQQHAFAGEQRERAAGRRLATIAHDLRNQLTLSLLQLERLEAPRAGHAAPEAAPKAAPEAAPEVAPEARALRAVLEGARDLCLDTLGRGGAAPDRSALVLRSILVEESRAAATFARDARRVRTLVRCPSHLRVHADRTTLARLVRNLLSNAIEASCDGGEVRAEAVATASGAVALTVEDDGRGMAAADLQTLFAPGATGGGGTGYGTASLLEALATLGAELDVETAPGRGTRARVLLPGIPDGESPAAMVLGSTGRRTRAWARALGEAGLAVHHTGTPAEALALLRRLPIELVVLARGTGQADDTRLAALLEHCARYGVRLVVASVLDGTPERQAGRIAALVRS
ncbi:MAG: HAMP domain-containing histidine kinase [Planctomycetota bacterium]|nr:MAG: HAMP domain-containing histidine kinase [Planctomycetota bacterium]